MHFTVSATHPFFNNPHPAMAILAKHFPSFHCLLTVKLSSPLPYLSLLNLSFFSTSIAPAAAENPHIQPQHNPFAQFLRNECGLSECEVSKVARARASLFTSGSRSAQPAQQAIQFFRDSGFTVDQVRKIIVRNPSVLYLKVDLQLKPKIERIEALGLSGKFLGKVLCRGPRFLTCSLEKTLSPIGSIERKMIPSVELLQQSGVQGELLLFLISRCPDILTESVDSLKFKIEYVREMGILQPSKAFVYALMVLRKNGPETLKKKLKHLASLGLLEHEIKELIKKYPLVLNVSVEKVQKNMEYLVHIAGFPPNTVVSYPAFVCYSLESRIKPRHRVLKFITAQQPSKRFPLLTSLLQLGEQKFLEKYVKCSTHATTLLDIYRGKAVDLNIIQSPSLQD